MKKIQNCLFGLLLLAIYSGGAYSQELCVDIAGIQVPCVSKYVRDINTNLDSSTVNGGSFNAETFLNMTTTEIKSQVDGNVANQPIIYKGCSMPPVGVTWQVGENICGDSASASTAYFSTVLLQSGSNEFPHGYKYAYYDYSSNYDLGNYSYGSLDLECKHGSWVTSNPKCAYASCGSYAYMGINGSGGTCIAVKVTSENSTTRNLAQLKHGESAWYNNQRIGVFNGDFNGLLTCNKGRYFDSNGNLPMCTPRACNATKYGWIQTSSSTSPVNNPNWGLSEYAVMVKVASGDGYIIPDTYSPSSTYFYKCLGDFPALAPNQSVVVYDKKNPANYATLKCYGGIPMASGPQICN